MGPRRDDPKHDEPLATINADELCDGMTMDDSFQVILDLETGEVITLPSDDTGLWNEELEDFDEHPDRYREVERVETHVQYQWMREFADSLDDAPDIVELLAVALDGRGAFRRFRDVLEGHPDLQTRWNALRSERLLERATAWLEAHNIRNPLSPPRALAAPPEQSAKPAASTKLGLVHVLLLGAPDGKTELLDGEVRRTITAQTAKQADQLVRRLVSEACSLHGIAYRRSLVDGRDRVTVGDITIVRRSLAVDVYVAISPSVWRAFTPA
ncbi:UPF0158 family protein [Enhygromyxa salina]|uniref:Uncharacterized protein n=1 Tax=Enhygromyxa salina TaxID=215803 RepID=A0A2S9YNK7_9BACT|nr:UPF0158 family protein [Enhygromyxa salina]PRQ06668.1 hypothetical protein ENSA7_35440 [Enhygromyxa salina]